MHCLNIFWIYQILWKTQIQFLSIFIWKIYYHVIFLLGVFFLSYLNKNALLTQYLYFTAFHILNRKKPQACKTSQAFMRDICNVLSSLSKMKKFNPRKCFLIYNIANNNWCIFITIWEKTCTVEAEMLNTLKCTFLKTIVKNVWFHKHLYGFILEYV